MNVVVVGTNHKYSPIEIREKLSFSEKRLKIAMVSLLTNNCIKAAAILSTCNRAEIYANCADVKIGAAWMKKFLSDYHKQPLGDIQPHLYTYIGRDAIRHLFKVASGIDSQIIGENQIHQQVRHFYNQAQLCETMDSFLSMIFQSALEASLKVRENTQISSGNVSIASAVGELIKTRFITLKDKNVLIIGVGKISEAVVKYMQKEKIKTVFISNRTYQKARQLARAVCAEVVNFDKLREKLAEADIIISATSSPHLILRKEDVLGVAGLRPLLIVDLAVPRDVDPAVKDIKGVELYCLDDLNFLIEKNLTRRVQEIPKALNIIENQVEALCSTARLELEQEPAPLP